MYSAARSAKPVLFDDQIEAMYAAGVRTFVEVGASSELTGLVRRVLGTKQHNALSLDRRGRHGLTSLQDAIGRLYTLGLDPDFSCWWAHRELPPAAVRAKSTVTVMIGRPFESGRRAVSGSEDMTSEAVMSGVVVPEAVVPEAVVFEKVVSEAVTPKPVAVAALAGSQLPVDREWLGTIAETRRQLADAHTTYQRMLTESHLAFVKASEAVLNALLAGEPVGD